MKTINRRRAIGAAAALALPVRAEAQPAEEPSRPLFVPLKTNPFGSGDLATINAKLFARHEAECWVHDHRDQLPIRYEELDRLPPLYREEVLRALPVATAVDLVLERIQRSADADRVMSSAQRAVLAEAPRYLTAEWAEADTDEREAMYPDGGFWERAHRAFKAEEWRRIFGQSPAIDVWVHGRFLALGDCAIAVGW